MVTIRCVGAAREVTGSRHLVETPGGTVLLDCGMVQGRRADANARNRDLGFRAKDVDACVLSHAHIDHSGVLPLLVKQGYPGPIYTTEPTADLLPVMLSDSAKIHVEDARYLNRRFPDDLVEPLYEPADVPPTLDRLVPLPYQTPQQILPGVSVQLLRAGHILGSATVLLTIDDQGREVRVGFSGDLGRMDPLLLRPRVQMPPVDALLLESTYGNRLHGSYVAAEEELCAVLARAARRKGRVIVPTFALERSQELVFLLNRLMVQGRAPTMPVVLDSPMATKVTHVFQKHLGSGEFGDELRRYVAEHGDPWDQVELIADVADSIALNTRPGPLVILSPSGMCESGRVLHHLRQSAGKASTSVVIVGFQAQGTLGRRIVEGIDEVKILGRTQPLEAQVRVLNAFSAHADRDGLLAWVDDMDHPPGKILLVHGESAQQAPLQRALEQRGLQVVRPEPGSTWRV